MIDRPFTPVPKPAIVMKERRQAKQRTPVKKVREKPRPGRLKGKDLKALRWACFKRDQFRCVSCGAKVCFERGYKDSGEMAHVRAKRRNGDVLDNVRTMCGPFLNDCHGKSHNAGGKPCPSKG